MALRAAGGEDHAPEASFGPGVGDFFAAYEGVDCRALALSRGIAMFVNRDPLNLEHIANLGLVGEPPVRDLPLGEQQLACVKLADLVINSDAVVGLLPELFGRSPEVATLIRGLIQNAHAFSLEARDVAVSIAAVASKAKEEKAERVFSRVLASKVFESKNGWRFPTARMFTPGLQAKMSSSLDEHRLPEDAQYHLQHAAQYLEVVNDAPRTPEKKDAPARLSLLRGTPDVIDSFGYFFENVIYVSLDRACDPLVFDHGCHGLIQGDPAHRFATWGGYMAMMSGLEEAGVRRLTLNDSTTILSSLTKEIVRRVGSGDWGMSLDYAMASGTQTAVGNINHATLFRPLQAVGRTIPDVPRVPRAPTQQGLVRERDGALVPASPHKKARAASDVRPAERYPRLAGGNPANPVTCQRASCDKASRMCFY